jgi:hypothetical protein
MTGESEEILLKLTVPKAAQTREPTNIGRFDGAEALFSLSHPGAQIGSMSENAEGDISIVGWSPQGRGLREVFRKSDVDRVARRSAGVNDQ